VPPLAVSVVEYGVPTVPFGNDVVVMVTPAATVIDRLRAGEVLPALSVTVTLKLNGLPTVVEGVPLIAPLEAFSHKPGGNEPALTVQLL